MEIYRSSIPEKRIKHTISRKLGKQQEERERLREGSGIIEETMVIDDAG